MTPRCHRWKHQEVLVELQGSWQDYMKHLKWDMETNAIWRQRKHIQWNRAEEVFSWSSLDLFSVLYQEVGPRCNGKYLPPNATGRGFKYGNQHLKKKKKKNLGFRLPTVLISIKVGVLCIGYNIFFKCFILVGVV